MDISRRGLFGLALGAVTTSPLTSLVAEAQDNGGSLPTVSDVGPGIITDTVVLNQVVLIEDMATLTSRLMPDDVELGFALSRSLKSQVQANVLIGAQGYVNQFTLAECLPAPTQWDAEVALLPADGYVDPALIDETDLSTDFTFEPDYSLMTYAELVTAEDEMFAYYPGEQPTVARTVAIKLLGLIVGGKAAKDLVDLLEAELSDIINKIGQILRGEGQYANMSRAERLKHAKRWLKRLWQKLLSKPFFNKLVTKIGREAAEKFIKKLLSKVIPVVGIGLLIVDIVLALADQLFGGTVPAPQTA